MIAKRVTVRVAVTVAVLFGLCLSAGMATAASDRPVMDSFSSEDELINSSVGEPPQQSQSSTVVAQSNSEQTFSSYDQLRGSSIQQDEVIVIDIGQSNTDVQLRQRLSPERTRLRAQIRSNGNGEIEIDTGEYYSGDYYLSSYELDLVDRPINITDTFTIYSTDTTSRSASRSFDSYGELSDTTIWQGQVFDVELPIPNAEIELRESLNQTTRIRKSVQTDGNGRVAVNTGGLSSGQFYLTGAGVNSGNTQRDGTFQVERQSLEVDFQRDQVIGNQQANTDISFNSTRFAYPVTVSATNSRGDDLDVQELTNVFEAADQFVVSKGNPRDYNPDTVTIQTTGEEGVVDFDQYTVDLSSIEDGRYSFTFDVADTTATTNSEIIVGQIDTIRTNGTERFNTYDELTGGVVWTGQTVVLEGLEANTDIQLRERTDDTSSQLVGEFRSNSNGTITIETTSYLSGDYFMIGGGTNSEYTPDLDQTFELITQSLTAEIKSDSVGNTEGSTTLFEIDSNRGRYPITVHANGELTSEELEKIFSTNPNAEFYEVQTTLQDSNGISDYDEIRFEGVADLDEYKLDFSGINSGEYELVFLVTDSVVADTAGVTVRESAGDQVEISSPEIDPSIVTNSSDSHTLTFEALNVSADGEQDDFTVEMPQSVEIVDVTDVAVVNGDYDVTHSNNESVIEFTVDPERNVDSVDLVFEVDMTLIGSDTAANG